MVDINDVVNGAVQNSRKMNAQFQLPSLGLIQQQNRVADARADFDEWQRTYFNPDGTEKYHATGVANPGFQVYEHTPFTDEIPSVQAGVNSLLETPLEVPDRMQRALSRMYSPEDTSVPENTVVADKGGDGNAVNTEMENAIRNELAASDDGTALYAMNVLRALPSVFARYENADPSIAMQNFLGGQQGRTRETEYFPGVSVR